MCKGQFSCRVPVMPVDSARRSLVVVGDASGGVVLTQEQEEVLHERLRGARAEGTWRVYQSAWREFVKWCAQQVPQITPLRVSPIQVALHLDAVAKKAGLSTVVIRRSAIAAAFETKGLESPTNASVVKQVLTAIHREKGSRPKAPKAAATADVMERLVSTIDRTTVGGKRDVALRLVGYTGAFRRSALCSLLVGDLRREPWGFAVTVRWDKGDQEGKGLVKALPSNPGPLDAAQALTDWLAVRQTAPADLLFPNTDPGYVALLVKRCARAAGFSPEEVKQLAGHSLRAGFVTEAVRCGADAIAIQQQTGHKSLDVLSRYVREIDPLKGNAVQRMIGKKP